MKVRHIDKLAKNCCPVNFLSTCVSLPKIVHPDLTVCSQCLFVADECTYERKHCIMTFTDIQLHWKWCKTVKVVNMINDTVCWFSTDRLSWT